MVSLYIQDFFVEYSFRKTKKLSEQAHIIGPHLEVQPSGFYGCYLKTSLFQPKDTLHIKCGRILTVVSIEIKMVQIPPNFPARPTFLTCKKQTRFFQAPLLLFL